MNTKQCFNFELEADGGLFQFDNEFQMSTL